MPPNLQCELEGYFITYLLKLVQLHSEGLSCRPLANLVTSLHA
jgi:hypothetical protein